MVFQLHTVVKPIWGISSYAVPLQGTIDSSRLVDVKPRVAEDVDKIKSWRIPDISDPSQIKALRLPDSIAASKVVDDVFEFSNFSLIWGRTPSHSFLIKSR